MRSSPSLALLRFLTTSSRASSAKARPCWCAARSSRAGLHPDTPDALDVPRRTTTPGCSTRRRPYPGMVETVLTALAPDVAGWPCSRTSPQRPTMQILEGPGDDDALQRRDRRRLGARPQARSGRLLDLVARAGVTPAETLLVGDSPVDLATARRAGTRICLARYGFGYRFDGIGFRGDEHFIDEAAELPAIVGAIE